jgi:hypothetical protein
MLNFHFTKYHDKSGRMKSGQMIEIRHIKNVLRKEFPNVNITHNSNIIHDSLCHINKPSLILTKNSKILCQIELDDVLNSLLYLRKIICRASCRFYIIHSNDNYNSRIFKKFKQSYVKQLLKNKYPNIELNIVERPFSYSHIDNGNIPNFVAKHIKNFPQFMIFNGKELIYTCNGFDVENKMVSIYQSIYD